MYINDISSGISSNIRLFADDCILYRIIKKKHDQDVLQADINQLIEWTKIWQMTFNASKCVVLRCSRLLTTLSYDYYINDSLLQLVSKHPYLGILLDSTMSFRSHIDIIINKATKVLNFLCRNLYKCNQEVRCSAYTHLMRPTYVGICILCVGPLSCKGHQLPRNGAKEGSTVGYIELWLAKWHKRFIYPGQSPVASTCTEKADIKA